MISHSVPIWRVLRLGQPDGGNGAAGGEGATLGDGVSVFVGTHVNKVDGKGRVSVPASFRALLADDSTFFAFPSFLHDGIECRTAAFMETLSDTVEGLEPFSDEQDHLAEAIFAASHSLTFDSEGRVVLPEALREHAVIADRAAFVGKGKTFQIWEPTSHEGFQKRARERALADRQALRKRPHQAPRPGGPVENGT